MKTVINEVRDIVHAMSEKRTDQLLKWGVGIIGGLCAIVAWFATHYFKT